MTRATKADPGAYDRVSQRIRAVTQGWATGAKLPQIRAEFDDLLAGPAPVPAVDTTCAGLAAIVARPVSAYADAAVLFLHGGGFQIGSLNSHRSLISRLAEATGLSVTGVAYRLAPEHRFPAAIDDCVAAYRALRGEAPARALFVAGDSAGGHLALDLALRVRDAGFPSPAGIILISPWLDLAARGDSYMSRAEADIFSKTPQLKAMARTYLGRDIDPASALVSPLDRPLAGLPPIHIEAGDDDITRDDATTLEARARAAGVSCTLNTWPGMFHHFQVFHDLPEAGQSLAAIAAFVTHTLRQPR